VDHLVVVVLVRRSQLLVVVVELEWVPQQPLQVVKVDWDLVFLGGLWVAVGLGSQEHQLVLVVQMPQQLIPVFL